MSVAEQNLTDRITYDDLYRRWEQNNWQATAIDFSEDRAGWEALTEIQRDSAMWIYSMFFYGEDSVADNLSPYIDAAPKEEQKYFLATQQVDEARHAIFFHRFFKEVIGAGDDVATTLAATEKHLGWGYRKVFERLDRMAAELRKDRSLPKFAQAITLYHLIVEATMAQPGQHFIEDFFVKDGTMPGFSAGMENISRDEQRHIGFGVKVLNELLRESDECKAAVNELLARGHAVDLVGVHPAELGPRVHPLLRVRARGHRRVGHEGDRAEVARGRLPDGRDAPRDLPDGHERPPPRARRADDQADAVRA